MKKDDLNKKYSRLLVRFGLILIPVLGALIVLIENNYSIAVWTTALAEWGLSISCLWLSWFISLYWLRYIRNNRLLKLFIPSILFQYVLIIVTSSLIVVSVLSVLVGVLGQTVTVNLAIANRFFPAQFLALFFCNMLFDIFLLSKEKSGEEEKVARLELIKARSELDLLKAQINPHFIYNSLNTLSYLTSHSPDSARIYINLFSDVYKYVLKNISKDWVFLNAELQFVQHYTTLQTIKAESSIEMLVAVSESISSSCIVPPLSVQLLVENAIKHNTFSSENPLKIVIGIEDDFLVVSNRVSPHSAILPTSKIGLYNLNERYKLLAGHEIRILNHFDHFTIFLPLYKNIPK